MHLTKEAIEYSGNIWSVYMHRNKINGKVYIGIAKDVHDRWGINGNGYFRSKNLTVFAKAILKYGWDSFEHLIIFENMSYHDAVSKEIELIAEYKSNCCRFQNPSYGYNCTDGGDGCAGYVFSEDAEKRRVDRLKEVMATSEWKQHNMDALRAVRETPEYKQRLLDGAQKRLNSDQWWDSMRNAWNSMKNDENWHQHHDEAMRKRCKPVQCIETGDVFSSAADAGRYLGKKGHHITSCCTGNRSIAYGFHWQYYFDDVDLDDAGEATRASDANSNR